MAGMQWLHCLRSQYITKCHGHIILFFNLTASWLPYPIAFCFWKLACPLPAHEKWDCYYHYFIHSLPVIKCPENSLTVSIAKQKWHITLFPKSSHLQSVKKRNILNEWIILITVITFISSKVSILLNKKVKSYSFLHTSSSDPIFISIRERETVLFPVARVYDMASDLQHRLVWITSFGNRNQGLFHLCRSYDVSLGFPFLFFISFMKWCPS